MLIPTPRFVSRLGGLALLSALAAACATEPSFPSADWPPLPPLGTSAGPLQELANDLDVAAADRRARVTRVLGRVGGRAVVDLLAPKIADGDPLVAERAAFAVGASGDPQAPQAIRDWLPSSAPLAVVEAAAHGLAFCTDPSAQDVLLELCRHEALPVTGPEALFAHWRWRDRSAHPVPHVLPDPALLRYEQHADPRGRAGLGWIGRMVRDPRLLEPLARLAADRDPGVRRAVALGLSQGPEDRPRSIDDARRALDVLSGLLRDADWRVVVAALRSASSYDDPRVADWLVEPLHHDVFHVRSAAIQGLARRDVKHAGRVLDRIAREDSSVSVRHDAAVALAKLDPERAAKLVDVMLMAPEEYLRVAGCEILGEDDSETATARLIARFKSDAHPRVRHTALGKLEGRKGRTVKDAVQQALADDDPVVVAVACDLVAKNELLDLRGKVRLVPVRYGDVFQADARQGAVGAMAEFGDAADVEELKKALSDPVPAVRFEARRGLAKIAGEDAPDARALQGRVGIEDVDPGLLAQVERLSPRMSLDVETTRGRMVIQLFPHLAPLHCAHVAQLANTGFYDGLSWHRVVSDFVIQGGCPRGDGSGSAGVSVPLEPTPVPYERGVLGMPRSSHPDTGGCQLFVTHSRQPHLDVWYTAFGRVVEGLHVIDRIDVDDKILRIRATGLR